ncbi:Ras-related protein Rab-27A [Balamuthia mandrillaris]
MSFLWSSSSSSKTNSNTRASTTVVTTEDNSRESAAATTAPNAAAPLQVSHAFKLLIVGDSGVGKSSILSQYVEGEFYKEFVSTLGVDFRSRILRLSGNLTEDLQGDNTSSAGAGSSRSLTGVLAKLQIFDSAGQDRFRAITQSYYRLANGIMLVYDVTNPQSFQSLEAWLRDIRSKGPPGVPILLVGNQADKASWRVISSEEGLAFAEGHGLAFIETSAKTGHNLQQAFKLLATAVLASQQPVQSQQRKASTTKQPQQRVGLRRVQRQRQRSCFCFGFNFGC